MGSGNSIFIKLPCIPRKYKLKRLERDVLEQIQRHETSLHSSLATEQVLTESIFNHPSDREAKRLYETELVPQHRVTQRLRSTLNALRRILMFQTDQSELKAVFQTATDLMGGDIADQYLDQVGDVAAFLDDTERIEGETITAFQQQVDTESVEVQAGWVEMKTKRKAHQQKRTEPATAVFYESRILEEEPDVQEYAHSSTPLLQRA